MREIYDETILSNGIKVVTERMPHSQSVSIGIWVRSGPIFETEKEAGISHFVEHMVFKGTKTRSAREINESLYPVGGHLNAFTDRELTCYTAVVLTEHTGIALEVLSDMLLHSLFREEDVEKERNVVLEEIRAIEDAPEDLVHDVLVEGLWPGHPLGRPVIGQLSTVQSFGRSAVTDYVERRYTAGNVLVSAAGNLDHKRFTELVERCFESWQPGPSLDAPPPPVASAAVTLIQRKTEQAHLCLGIPAYGQKDPRNYPLAILDTVIGGGPHSRLFDEVRENRGLAYNVGSSVNSYAQCGVFTVFASTSVKNLPELVDIVREELRRVVDEGLPQEEIDRARSHIRSSLILAHESTGSRMGRLANSHLYFGRTIPHREVLKKLDAVTAADVLDVSRELFSSDKTAMAVIGPINPRGRSAAKLRAA